MPPPTALPGFADVLAARERLLGQAHVTPVLTCRALDERVGASVFLKCESFQRVGAFKFRGAYNAISRLTAEEKRRGVIAFSSGNHAQAVALACRILGTHATIVMPTDAPAVKRAATEAYGARVVAYDRAAGEGREAMARRLRDEGDLVLIPPFDHPHIIAGQGTAALELLDEVGELDQLLVPCGGGGLLSGSALAARGVRPGCRVIGVEPEAGDDATRSFRSGTLQRVEDPQTLADGTRTESLGHLTFPLIRAHVDDLQTVPEEAIAEAVRLLFHRAKLVVEPSGALPLAALLTGAVPPRPRTGLILSGGNVDGETMAGILTHRLP